MTRNWNRLVLTGIAAGAMCYGLLSSAAAQVETPEAPADADVQIRQQQQQQTEPRATPPQPPADIRGDVRQRGDVDVRADDSARGRARTQTDLGLQFDQEGDQGLMISGVQQNSIAAQAGLQQGDQIVSVDGRQFSSSAEMNAYLQQQGQRRVPITFLRNGQRYRTTIMAMGQVQAPGQFAPPRDQFAPPQQGFAGQFGQQGALGVSLQPGFQGVILSAVHFDSPAHQAGLLPGDEIICVNGWGVGGVNHLISTIGQYPAGQPIGIDVLRQGRTVSTRVQLAPPEQAFAGEPIRSPDQLLAGGEFDAPPAPPQVAERQIPGRERTALRPDLEAMSRQQLQQEVEALQHEVDALEQDNQSLQRELERARGNLQQPQQQRDIETPQQRDIETPQQRDIETPPETQSSPPATPPKEGQ